MSELVLSARTRCLYELIEQAATAGLETPSSGMLTTALLLRGHRISANKGLIHWEIKRLEQAGLVRLNHDGKRRILEIVSTGARTRPRTASIGFTPAMLDAQERKREAKADWPKPTKASAAAYDAAMALRPFATAHREPSSWPHVSIRGAESRSSVGCSLVLES